MHGTGRRLARAPGPRQSANCLNQNGRSPYPGAGQEWTPKRGARALNEARDQQTEPASEHPEDETGTAPAPGEEREADSPEEEIARLHAALADAREALATQRDAVLRHQADTENLRKRLLREQEKAQRYALERIVADLLPVRDSLERGLEVSEEAATVESLRDGKALTLKMLGKVLADHGLEVIDPAGQPFDPEWHEAMSMQPSEEHPQNTVIQVLQKGYRLHDRLLRPAMVVVSSGAPEQ